MVLVVRKVVPALVAAALLIGTTLGPLPAARADHSCDHPPNAPDPIPPPTLEPARIRPAHTRIHLAHGESVRRTYTFDRPASPTPADVYFLVDTTNSMASAICGVQIGLVDIALGLHEAGIDARFGVAEFRDYTGDWGTTSDFAYRRQRAVGPLDRELIDALTRLRAEGGTGDGLTSGLAALYQTATGEGQDVRPRGESRGDIPAGKGAEFRPDALKVVITVTDVAFREPRDHPGYPGPSWRRVVDALRARSILQAGIDVAGDADGLRPMARETGARAPSGGVDCDDDGDIDLGAGDPLVCTLPPPPVVSIGDPVEELHLAPAIIELVKAVRDYARVHTTVTADRRIVRGAHPEVSRAIDLKTANRARFRMTYRCDELPGTQRVEIVSRIRGEVVARSDARVTCEPPPGLAVIAPPAAAAVAPAQPQAPQPQTQSQAQAQAATGTQPNTAVVPAPQVQPQVAVQLADDAEGYAMSARGRTRGVPAPVTTAAGAVLAIAAALLRARTQTRPQTIDPEEGRR